MRIFIDNCTQPLLVAAIELLRVASIRGSALSIRDDDDTRGIIVLAKAADAAEALCVLERSGFTVRLDNRGK